MRSMIFALIATASLSLGCATLLDISQDACEAALGGSKAAELCEQIDKLRSDEATDATAE